MQRPKAGPTTSWRKLVVTFVTTAYVCAAAVRAMEGRGVRTWGLVALALVTALVAARRRGDAEGEGTLYKERASWVAGWGLAIVFASLAPSGEHPWIEAMGALGALAASGAACWALSRVASPASLARSRPTPAEWGLFVLAAAWGFAIATHVASALHVKWVWADRASLVAGGAAVASWAVLLLSAAIVLIRRRLELGVAPRVAAAMGIIATLSLLSAAVGMLRIEDGDRVGRLAVAIIALVVVWIALHADGIVVARVSRRLLVLAFVGGGVAMLGAGAADGGPRHAAIVALLTAAATLAVGSGARLLEGPLRPVRGEWLDAIEEARMSLLENDPDEAVRIALVALRKPAGPTAASPELWTLDPMRLATVDAAGYMREREGVLPERVLEIAGAEPESTLRLEVLESLEVRRPDLRPLCGWMQVHGALTATVVTRGGDPEGLLIVPAGARTELVSLEEARALKKLADALASVCHSRSAHARALERARLLSIRAEKAEEEVEALRHARALEAGRHALATARLARPATVGVYAATSRMALEAIERRAQAGVPIAIVAPSGVDPVPYLARAHLAGPRRDAPFALVDATTAREHDLARWNDPASSPLALADGGMLVLLDVAALPADVQRIVARALAEKRTPWERPEPLDLALAVTTAGAEMALDPALAARLGDALSAPVVLPRLHERAEDLRAILTDRLAREGLRVRGAAMGMDAVAYARLVDYPFPGEDAELAAIVQRLVACARADVIRAEDVQRVLEERAAALENDTTGHRESPASGEDAAVRKSRAV